jgi:hypothetical protein
VEHEFLKDSDRSLREISVAQTDQEMALHLNHYFKPILEVSISELKLDSCVEDLDVGLL